MGDKISARAKISKLKIPLLPSVKIDENKNLKTTVNDIGYPVIIKAAAGNEIGIRLPRINQGDVVDEVLARLLDVDIDPAAGGRGQDQQGDRGRRRRGRRLRAHVRGRQEVGSTRAQRGLFFIKWILLRFWVARSMAEFLLRRFY